MKNVVSFSDILSEKPTEFNIAVSMNSLGEKIRQIRQNNGFSQENMADMLGISTSAYGDIERNKTDLTVNRAKEIAKILNISYLELLGLDFSEFNHSLEKANLEIEKLKIENEKLQLEVLYWREKFEKLALNEVYRMLHQQERQSIGFKHPKLIGD